MAKNKNKRTKQIGAGQSDRDMAGEKINRFYRSRRDKVIAGVFGGIASQFKLDPVIVRLTAVLFLLLLTFNVPHGLLVFVLLYAMAWIVVPLER
ncbi:MAG: PspC domain-containing protein [Candidatus Micrarchaeota archaeon]